MAAAALNTLHYARRLKQAETMAEALDEVLVAHIANKADVAELRADFTELRADTRTEIAAVRTDMHAEFKNLYRYLWIMGASIVALNVTLTVTFTKVLV